MKLKRLLIFLGVAGASFAVAYGASAKAWPTPYHTGYFTGAYDTWGVEIWPVDSDSPGCPASGGNAIPSWVDTTGEFINYVKCKLNSPNNYGPYVNMERTGAAFIIQTMRGANDRYFPNAAQIADWESRVNYYSSRGWISWNVSFGYAFNSFYQGTYNSSSPNDDAFFGNNSSAASIVFSNGSTAYGIRRQCANPVGSGLAQLEQPWAGQGRTTVTSGASSGTSITVNPGASLTFRQYIRNNGPGTASMWYALYGRNGTTTPWTAQYYNNTSLSGSPVLTRTEQDINYIDNSGGVAPGPGVIADGFSARWTRTQSFTAGDYLFTMKIDDGGRLYVDGVLIIDRWIGQGATPYSATRTLSAGNHTIEMRYYEGGGPGWATLDYTNYLVQGGTNAGAFSNGQEKLVQTENYTVPSNATNGSQYCRRLLWDWRNSSGSGEWGLGTAGMGALACATVVLPPFTMSATTTLNNSAPGPGDTINFTHTLTASASTSSTTINWTTQNMPGGSTVASGNAGTFTASQSKSVGSESYTVPSGTPDGTQICRRISFNPLNESGGSGTSTQRCATVVAPLDYNLDPSILVLVNGGATLDNRAEAGDTITFNYGVNNTGSTTSDNVTCTYRQATYTGYNESPPTTTFTPSGANCAPSRTFPVGNTTVAIENVSSLSTNTTVCRSLSVNSVSYSGLPYSWNTRDVGAVGAAGSATADNGVFTMRGSGADIWSTADEFRYTYLRLNGNGEIIARVTTLSNTNAWAKSGVMIRESLGDDSRHAFMAISPTSGTAFQRRLASAGATTSTTGPAVAVPYWVRLVRSGNTFTAYTSPNGSTWTNVGSDTIAMGSNVYAGLALTSHNDGVLADSIFDNVSVNGAPVTGGGGATEQACVLVTAKPYARVYGGDILVGGGVETAPNSCDADPDAAIIGWNRGSTAGYAGAGAQYAALAMNTIMGTASSLGNTGGASTPIGLSFANTITDAAAGDFGGTFGSAPCIQDHYATLPGSTSSIPGAVSSMSDGAYAGTGNFTLNGGTVDPGEQISVYVDGNVFINGEITYGSSGSWSSTDIPLFRLIVRGNIFVDNDVDRLDGLYVAQPQAGGATDGVIYTCGTLASMFTPLTLDADVATQCDNDELTVNGSLSARQIRLMRTVGTVGRSIASEGPSSTNIAEIFNYTPALWISQPPVTSQNIGDYDAITSLPPVL